MTFPALGNAGFFRAVRVHHILFLALALRWYLMSGFVLGDDPIYGDYVDGLLKGRYPFPCDTCVFAFRWLLLGSMWLSMRCLGWSELSFVFPILVSSIVTVYLAWSLARHLFDEETARFAALLQAVFPLDLVHATTLSNDLLLAAVLGLAMLFYLKAFDATRGKGLLLFGLAGGILASAIGVKINSLPVVVLFLLIAAYKAWKGVNRSTGLTVFLLVWLAVQASVCMAFHMKTGDYLAHIHAELNFNLRFNPSDFKDTQERLTSALLFYPRFMLGLRGEGHAGYTFLPYGWFYPVFLVSLVWFAARREGRMAIPILWFFFLFLMMEFTPLRVQPYYQPIHRLPRFLAIVTMPVVLSIAFFLRRLLSGAFPPRLLGCILLTVLTVTSVHEAYRKSFFYNDCMADARLAYELVKHMPFSEIATDHEMKNALLFYDQHRSAGLIHSFDYERPGFPAESLVILGGARRPDMLPEYAADFVSTVVPGSNWIKICEVVRTDRVWRLKNLSIYRVLDTGGQP